MKYLFLFFIAIIIGLNAKEAITPLPKTVQFDYKKAKLGKELFFDTTLSRDNSTACISCHNIYDGGADARIVSRGFNGQKGNIQSPTVLNAVFNFKQFWNARANDLYEQANGPLTNPVEHNMTPNLVVKRVSKNIKYKQKFEKIYKDGITYKNVIDAIVEFEKALVTPDSKFDKYLRGEIKLNQNEKRGYELFKQYGCISCHNGRNIGGNLLAKIGIFEPYINNKEYPDRYDITNDKSDINVFKVPTLRNIALTSPYFHDGSQKTLKDAIHAMGYYNLGIELQAQEIQYIEDFLKTLTGNLPKIANE
jgi:cytochrome c peroxidase